MKPFTSCDNRHGQLGFPPCGGIMQTTMTVTYTPSSESHELTVCNTCAQRIKLDAKSRGYTCS